MSYAIALDSEFIFSRLSRNPHCFEIITLLIKFFLYSFLLFCTNMIRFEY